MENPVENLFQELLNPSRDVNEILAELKALEKHVVYFCESFPFPAAIDYLSSSELTNTSKAIILYFIGLFSKLPSFPIDLFENESVLELLFSFLAGRGMIQKQSIRALQEITNKSCFAAEFLLNHDFISFAAQSKPFFRTINTINAIFNHNDNNDIRTILLTPEIHEILIEIVVSYVQCGENEQIGALNLLYSMLDFYKVSEEASEALKIILNDNEKINISAFLQSGNSKAIEASARLLVKMDTASIEFVDILIDCYLKGSLPLHTVFAVFLKHVDEWSGYNRDIVIDFIRNGIPTAPFETAKIGIKLYLAFCNLADEWDGEIAEVISRFASEEDMTAMILNAFINCINTAKDLEEEDKLELDAIIQELIPVAEESLNSSNVEVSEVANMFLTTTDQL